MGIASDRLFARMVKRATASSVPSPRDVAVVSLDVRSNSAWGKSLRQDGIPRSPEFERVTALPKRVWTERADLDALQEEISAVLRAPGGEQTARPVQAVTLTELKAIGSALGAISVGEGKTLISFVASTFLGAESTVLLIPANLSEKTKTEFARLSQHWKAPKGLRIVHYQQLGRVRYANVLENIQPDLIICDEVHWLKNLTAACTKRVDRYMTEKPETGFLGMSGTITKRSLMDFHHILRWVFGTEKMPLPATQSEARRWALAVDTKLIAERMKPGVLAEMIEDPAKRSPQNFSGPKLADVRQAVGQRIINTPGVIANLTDDVDASIHIHYYAPDLDSDVRTKMAKITDSGKSLNGDVVMSPVEYWRHMRELSCGFYREWTESPPREWMTARQEFGSFVRRVLERPGHEMDTPLQVTNAIVRGTLDDGGLYAQWKTIEPIFTPVSVAHWVSYKPMEDVIKRAEKTPTLIWVEHAPVGEMLMEMSGFRYFHHGGIDQHKTPIDALEGGEESLILSISSNKEGRNLQAWSHNDLVSPPPNGGTMEQVMGRTHRSLQEADEVTFDIAIGHNLVMEGMRQAYADAHYTTSTVGKKQKLLLADTSGIKIHGVKT